MTETTSPTVCPPWCLGDHAGGSPDVVGHAATVVEVRLPALPGREPSAASVMVCRYDSADREPTYVELVAPSNVGCLEVTALTPREAVDLAGELVRAAGSAGDDEGARS